LLRFFETMPADNGMAFVIVVHLSPEHESNLVSLLQAKTGMPVLAVKDVVDVAPNHVYVISPNQDLVMDDGRLQAVSAVRPRGRHVAIDSFLRSLAEVHRERAVGIILSGADSDGAVGITRIKEKGGTAIAQSPDDAEYDAMPRQAIESGAVDWILSVSEMPQKLLELTHNAAVIDLSITGTVDNEADAATATTDATGVAVQAPERVLGDILSTLQRRTGHDFHHYKRATILRRLDRRLQVNRLPNLLAYKAYLDTHPEETQLLLQDMLIGVTNFFRDPKAFEALERDVLPRIFEQTNPKEQIRAWSVGCATGEEAYSTAMLLAEQNALETRPRQIQVFASDIDERAIANARRGIYPQSIAVDVTPGRLRQHFVKEDKHYSIKKDIREKVMFAVHNILHDPAFSKIHLIVCRNLLIYLNRDIQKKVFEIFHYALQPGGYLFLGSSESADAVPELFSFVDKKNRIYQASSLKSSVMQAVPEPTTAPRKQVSAAPIANQSGRRKASASQSDWRLLDNYALPGVFIDEEDELLYAAKRAGHFLQVPGGEPSHNILMLIHPDLRLELQTALYQAKQSKQPVTTGYIALRKDDQTTAVRLQVYPPTGQQAGRSPVLVLFEESSHANLASVLQGDGSDNPVIARLEQELQHTKEQLQAVIEQNEVALEEAKSANEEMQAVNEELRSATEELETSKEELQSINEELVTVNAQLKMKVDETSKANDDLQNFVAATEIATLFIDRRMHIRSYTKPCTKLFNIIASDVGRPLLDITHRLEYPDLARDIEHVLDHLLPMEREVRSTEGQWYIARLLPYRTAEDHIAGLVLSFIDISLRRAAEDKLLQSEQRMRQISASTRDYAIISMNRDGIITSWNNGATRVFGYSEPEMVGQSAIVLFTAEDRARGVFQDELRRAHTHGRAEDDRWHVRKDGSLVFCSGITTPLADDGVEGYAKICRDMTGSKWMQDQQAAKLEWEKRERQRAEEAARLRDEFFAVLSHELKQPLNLIQLTAEMLSRMPEAATQPAIARGTGTIKHMVESQARIIDDLMDLSRLHTGKLTLTPTLVNFSEAVSHVVNLMTKDAQQKQVALSLALAPSDLLVHGDAVRLEQIVWNLLSNALKFTPAGGNVQVRLSQEGETACLEVADTGKGVAPEFLPFIFDMFRQGDTGTTRQYGGMGIGLALVKELVHSHGGRVEAHSEGIGQGALFRIFLPLADGRVKASGPKNVDDISLSGKRILLVDDTIQTLEALENLLAMDGAQVATASSGAEAIKMAQEAAEPYHLIISDIGMPGMDGYMLLAELRKVKATATTPAIALSGFARPKDVERALQAGYKMHIGKPVLFEEFLTAASRVCS